MLKKIKNSFQIISISIVLTIASVFLLIQFSLPKDIGAENMQFDEQSATIRAIAEVQETVVSIIVYDEGDLNINQ